MNESIIAVRYAKALQQLAREKNSSEQVYNDMTLVLNVAAEVREFQTFLESPIIQPSKKIEISSKIFEAFNPLTTTFLNTLYTNRRENILNDIARKFISVVNSEKKITVATVITTTPIHADTKENILKLIGKKYNTEKVELHEAIDESLIGGFIIKVNDQQLDASISTKLGEVKRKLLKTPVK